MNTPPSETESYKESYHNRTKECGNDYVEKYFQG
jgi:hypothetical protein